MLEVLHVEGGYIEAQVQGRGSDDEVFEGDGDALGGLLALDASGKLRAWIPKIWNAGLPVIDDLHTDSYVWKPEEKTEKFIALLKELKPGITEIIFHASIPTDDFPLITTSSSARLADTRALTDPAVKQLIQQRGIILTTWKELKQRRKQAEPME